MLLCKLMRCMNKDSLAAVRPVAMESVVVPPGGSCARLADLDAVKPVSSSGCACGMHMMHGGGAKEAVKLRAATVVFC